MPETWCILSAFASVFCRAFAAGGMFFCAALLFKAAFLLPWYGSDYAKAAVL